MAQYQRTTQAQATHMLLVRIKTSGLGTRYSDQGVHSTAQAIVKAGRLHASGYGYRLVPMRKAS